MTMDNESYRQEVWLAWGAALAGLVFAATVWNGNLLINVVYTWGPQALALIIMFFSRARPAAIAGAALGFAGYLGFFNWWVHAYHPTDGLVWLIYLFSLPGGAIGAIAASVSFNRGDERPARKAVLTAAGLVLAGTLINQLAVLFALSS